MSETTFGRYKANVEERIEIYKWLALRSKVKPENTHMEIYGGSSTGIGNIFAQPNGLRVSAQTAISVGRPGHARNKKEVYQ